MDGSVIYWIFSSGSGSDYGWISDLLDIFRRTWLRLWSVINWIFSGGPGSDYGQWFIGYFQEDLAPTINGSLIYWIFSGGPGSTMDGSVIYWIFSSGSGSDYGWISDLLDIFRRTWLRLWMDQWFIGNWHTGWHHSPAICEHSGRLVWINSLVADTLRWESWITVLYRGAMPIQITIYILFYFNVNGW